MSNSNILSQHHNWRVTISTKKFKTWLIGLERFRIQCSHLEIRLLNRWSKPITACSLVASGEEFGPIDWCKTSTGLSRNLIRMCHWEILPRLENLNSSNILTRATQSLGSWTKMSQRTIMTRSSPICRHHWRIKFCLLSTYLSSTLSSIIA